MRARSRSRAGTNRFGGAVRGRSSDAPTQVPCLCFSGVPKRWSPPRACVDRLSPGGGRVAGRGGIGAGGVRAGPGLGATAGHDGVRRGRVRGRQASAVPSAGGRSAHSFGQEGDGDRLRRVAEGAGEQLPAGAGDDAGAVVQRGDHAAGQPRVSRSGRTAPHAVPPGPEGWHSHSRGPDRVSRGVLHAAAGRGGPARVRAGRGCVALWAAAGGRVELRDLHAPAGPAVFDPQLSDLRFG